MAHDEKYNGWTNYATWRVNLEIIDDYINSLEWGYDHPTFNDLNEFAHHLSDEAEEVITNFGELQDGLALDYARAFLADVDWYEIAENHAADHPELIAESDES